MLFLVFFSICGVLFSYVSATESAEDRLMQDFTSVLVECMETNPVDEKELEKMTENDIPDSEPIRCLYACAFKKTGMMDDDGKLSAEGSRNLTKNYFADDAEKIKTSDEFLDLCMKINKEPVSDGKKGCDRAAMVFKCAIDNKSELNLF